MIKDCNIVRSSEFRLKIIGYNLDSSRFFITTVADIAKIISFIRKKVDKTETVSYREGLHVRLVHEVGGAGCAHTDHYGFLL